MESNMKPKLSQKQKYRIAGGSGLILGIYMLLVLNSNEGYIPLGISAILLFIGFKK